MLLIFIVLLAFLGACVADLPLLNVSGFGWAENLAFDGHGSMFVSEHSRGEMIRINLCKDGTDYCQAVHLSGFKNIGGLSISPDGNTIYAGVTFEDKSTHIVSTSTAQVNNGQYSTIAKTSNQCNGMQLFNSILYCTSEGGVKGDGYVFTVDLATGTEQVVYTNLNADGAWINPLTQHLFVGQVESMKVAVFNISSTSRDVIFAGNFAGPGGQIKHPGLSILDDLTLASPGGESESDGDDSKGIGSTQLFGADWLGKKLLRFSLDGSSMEEVPVPAGIKLKELTSVRWGKGPGFDEKSVYVSEGGGFKGITNRSIVQIKL